MRITILPRPLQVRIRAPRLSGCWRWTGSVSPAVYARFNGRCAPRVAWVHVNGQIPERMVLHHACGTRECVRPDHLRLVERGKTRPSRQALDWLAARLEVDHEYLETGLSG